MKTFVVWLVALVLYGTFLAWYDNWRGALTATEIDQLMRTIEAMGVGDKTRNDLPAFRRFLEQDDGQEFYMLNLMRVAPGTVADPATGEQRKATEVLEGYSRMFMPALFARAGHPALLARKVGPYLDAWGVEADPGWTTFGIIRYRSRRDVAELVANPAFAGAHDFKFAAMPSTFAFPTQPRVVTFVSPRITIALTLGLLAAVVQIGWLLKLKGG